MYALFKLCLVCKVRLSYKLALKILYRQQFAYFPHFTLNIPIYAGGNRKTICPIPTIAG